MYKNGLLNKIKIGNEITIILFLHLLFLCFILLSNNNQRIIINFKSNILKNEEKYVLLNKISEGNTITYENAIKNDDEYVKNYKGGELEPEWNWVKNISILYTWTDESEIDLLEMKLPYHCKEKTSKFHSIDNLKYSIRSVEKYLPWHEGNIIIFTTHQIPYWINITNPKVKMIYHQDVIPKHLLPTFDTNVIELYLDKIPGITEQFLFFNEDLFLNNYIHPAFFFTTKEHYPKVYMEKDVTTFNKKDVEKKMNCDDALGNAYHTDLIIKKYFDSKFKFHNMKHSIHVFYRDLLEPFRQYFENELKISLSDKYKNPYKPHTIYLYTMFQYYATQHEEFPKKIYGNGKNEDFEGYELPKDRTIQKYSTVIIYPNDENELIKYDDVEDYIIDNNENFIYYETHPEILVYTLKIRYTREEPVLQFLKYLTKRYPSPSSIEIQKYVNMETIIYEELNEIENFEKPFEFNDSADEDDKKELENESLFKQTLKIIKDFVQLKKSFIIEPEMSIRDQEEIESFQTYSNGNKTLVKEWEWVKNISMIYIFDSNENETEIKKLNHSIYSLIKYLPWFEGKIYIISSNKDKNSINKLKSLITVKHNDQIQIVSVDEILPESYKTNYNLHTLEMYLDKIPNLSERFVYLNQNHFLKKYTHPSFFFTNEEFFPKYNLKSPLTGKEMKNIEKEDKAFFNTFRLIEEYYGKSYIRYWRYLKNTPIPLYRDLFEPVRQLYKTHLDDVFQKVNENEKGNEKGNENENKNENKNENEIEIENNDLLPIYLVVNYNIYSTSQKYYPNYVTGYGKIRDAKLPVLNPKRTIEYYGFEETSPNVAKVIMDTDLILTKSLCYVADDVLFFSINNSNNAEKEEEKVEKLLLSSYFENECNPTTKISVVLPTYNSAKYLDRTIHTFYNQTFKEIELIIINDASSDNTTTVLSKYENYDRITIVNLEENGGAGRARNIGMDLANGEFIGFMDADDFVDERFFENLFKKTEGYDVVVGHFVDCISTSIYCSYNKDQTNYDLNIINKTKTKMRPYGFIYNSLWRKKFIFKNNIRFSLNRKVVEDQVFRIELYKKNPRLIKLPDDKIYYYYERKFGSLNPNNNKNFWLNVVLRRGQRDKIPNRGRYIDIE